jgi:hypothetical protein
MKGINPYLKDERGLVKGLFILAVVVAIAFAGIQFGKPYYRYNTLRSYTKDTILMEGENVQVIRTKVLEEAEELKVPLDEEDLEVTVNQAKIVKVKAKWSEVVDFWGYYSKRLDFDLNVEG